MNTCDQNIMIYKRLIFELTVIRSIFENNIQSDKIYIDKYIKMLDNMENNYFVVIKNLYSTEQ